MPFRWADGPLLPIIPFLGSTTSPALRSETPYGVGPVSIGLFSKISVYSGGSNAARGGVVDEQARIEARCDGPQ